MSSKLKTPTSLSVKKRLNMASSLKNLINRFTPNASSADLSSSGFSTAKTPTQLFPQTEPALDGEECLHDCESCTIKYPRKFNIDEDDQLYGLVKGWSRHILCATGKTDWVCALCFAMYESVEAYSESR
jgi:hypothetical protein